MTTTAPSSQQQQQQQQALPPATNVHYTDVLQFVSSLSGHVYDHCVGYEFSGLDYCLALHIVCPQSVDLAKACWVPQPTPKQLEGNLAFFLQCATDFENPAGCEFPSCLVRGAESLRPTKECFMNHMLVQRWLYALRAHYLVTPGAGAARPDLLRRKFAMPVPLSQRAPAALQEALELVVAEKQGYRQCWREVERALLSMLEQTAEVDMKKLQSVLAATQPTRVL